MASTASELLRVLREKHFLRDESKQYAFECAFLCDGSLVDGVLIITDLRVLGASDTREGIVTIEFPFETFVTIESIGDSITLSSGEASQRFTRIKSDALPEAVRYAAQHFAPVSAPSPLQSFKVLRRSASGIVDDVSSSPDANKWIAFFLCLFLGVLMAHRFYAHRKDAVKMLIVSLVTAGIAGAIIALMDLIKILSGTFMDGDGKLL